MFDDMEGCSQYINWVKEEEVCYVINIKIHIEENFEAVIYVNVLGNIVSFSISLVLYTNM